MAGKESCEIRALIAVAKWNERRAEKLKNKDPRSAKRMRQNAAMVRSIAKECDND